MRALLEHILELNSKEKIRGASDKAYEYLQTLPEKKPRASVINFLNDMVEEGILTTRRKREKIRGLQEAAQKPEIFRNVYRHYADGKYPKSDTFFKNMLEKDFGVPNYSWRAVVGQDFRLALASLVLFVHST